MKIELCDHCGKMAVQFEGATIKIWQHTKKNKGKVPWGKNIRLCKKCYKYFKNEYQP
jgi:hypothetical protein